MELVYTNYKITLDLIIGQIHDDMFISQHVAITSYEIVAHIDVFTVFEFPHRDLKEPLTPFVLILAINKTSNVLAWVGDDVNQTIVIVSASAEKGGFLQFLLGRIMVVDVGDLPVFAISPLR